MRGNAVRRIANLERRLRDLKRSTPDEVCAAYERDCIRVRHKLFMLAAHEHPQLTPEPLPPEFAECAQRDKLILDHLSVVSSFSRRNSSRWEST